MDSKKLEILVTAADLGSFTKASEVAGYTQSGLTHMMDSLEKEIGLTLLLRGHGGVRLTPEGERLMPAIRQFLQAGAALENKIAEEQSHRQDVIRVAAYASIAMRWMPELLYRFRRVCPEVSVELRMVDHALEPFELLESGQADVIFAGRQEGQKCDWTALYQEPLYAILPKNHPLAGCGGFPLEEFAGQEFLMPYGRFDLEIKRVFDAAGLALNARATRVDDETVIRMVGRGLGISMMGELMIRGSVEDVVCIPVRPAAFRELGMGLPEGVPIRESLRKLLACMLNYLKESERPGL